jgi:multiple sugar transport system substrate-binding protein
VTAQSKFGQQYFDCLLGFGQDRPRRPAADHPGHGVPRRLRRGDDQHARRRGFAAELKKATETFAPVLAKSEQG